MAFEIITTTDKNARDKLFEDLRINGNSLERRVVKFSGNELVLNSFGNPTINYVRYTGKHGKAQARLVYRSTWSVAYPTS